MPNEDSVTPEVEPIPQVLARIVRHPHVRPDVGPVPLILATEDGVWPVSFALSTEDFQPGDLVEIRLIERCPQFGLERWSAERTEK